MGRAAAAAAVAAVAQRSTALRHVSAVSARWFKTCGTTSPSTPPLSTSSVRAAPLSTTTRSYTTTTTTTTTTTSSRTTSCSNNNSSRIHAQSTMTVPWRRLFHSTPSAAEASPSRHRRALRVRPHTSFLAPGPGAVTAAATKSHGRISVAMAMAGQGVSMRLPPRLDIGQGTSMYMGKERGVWRYGADVVSAAEEGGGGGGGGEGHDYTQGPGQGEILDREYIMFNPPAAPVTVYNTPFKFLPRSDPRRRAALAAHLFSRVRETAAARTSTSTTAPAATADTTSQLSMSSFEAQDAPLPPIAQPHNYEEGRTHLEPEDVEEIRRLRLSDPRRWSVTRLAKRFQCSEIFVMACVQAPEEHLRELQARTAAARERQSEAKKRAISDRLKRKAMLMRGEL